MACDTELDDRGCYSIVLFDGLDRSSARRNLVVDLVRGLLLHALDMRCYRRLRAKVFLRSDQATEPTIGDFSDSSKVISSSVQLTWLRRDLFGMLWQFLGNWGSGGKLLRKKLADGAWPSFAMGEDTIYVVPLSVTREDEVLRERFHAIITGPWMGTNPRRGFPFTWIPNHLGDAHQLVSPRSFVEALRAAARDTATNFPDHSHPLHYKSIKRGVQHASKIRVRELVEDYPWIQAVVGSLEGTVVPCGFDKVSERWETNDILSHLSSRR